MDYVGMVREFHQKLGLPVGDGLTDIPDLIRRKRMRLITEEFGELTTAMDQNDLLEVADAAADLVYVIAGTAVAYGVKVLPTGEFSRYVEVRKPRPTTGALDHDLEVTLIAQGAAQLNWTLSAIGQDMGWRIIDELTNFTKHVWHVCYLYGIPFDACFAEVHRSNMTKEKLNEFDKGGKGPLYEPPQLAPLLNLFNHA